MTSLPRRRRACRDLLLVVLAIVLAWLASRFWLYPALGVPDNAPMLLRPIAGFAMAWALLSLSGSRWSALGLVSPRNLPAAIAGAAVLYGVIYLASNHLVPLLAAIFEARAAPVFLSYIRGHPAALVGWLAIAWIVGGFIEELLFRGFLLNRIREWVGSGTLGAVAGVVGQALLFGLLHLYQGSFGFVFAATFALIYGVAYFALGRNLWPLIVVHGSWNSVAIVRLYGS